MKSSKIALLIIFLLAAIILVACFIIFYRPANQINGNNNQADNSTGLANPASVYCLDSGGRLEMRLAADGSQMGYCVFAVGKECEEWAFYRGECNKEGVTKNILISNSPTNGQSSLPITVTGRARVFENTLNFRLKDKDGTLLVSGFTNADSPDIGLYGDFTVKIDALWQKPKTEDVVLEIYWASPKDGSDLDLNIIPLKLTLPETTTLKIYFNNNKLDPEVSCNKVFPVERIVPKTVTPARQALDLLLLGISSDEQDRGFFTSINYGVKINSLVITNGVAKVDFDPILEAHVGGSCRVAAIRSQITETLKQFSSIKSVVISIDGRTEDILQP